jgi:hypothetical protein
MCLLNGTAAVHWVQRMYAGMQANGSDDTATCPAKQLQLPWRIYISSAIPKQMHHLRLASFQQNTCNRHKIRLSEAHSYKRCLHNCCAVAANNSCFRLQATCTWSKPHVVMSATLRFTGTPITRRPTKHITAPAGCALALRSSTNHRIAQPQ